MYCSSNIKYNNHCRRVQSLSRRYDTFTPHRPTHNDGIYRAIIASRDKNTPNSNLADIYRKNSNLTSYHPSATKVICEELRSQPSRKEWTRPLRVLLAAAQYPLQTSPVIQPRVCYIDATAPHASYTFSICSGNSQ